MERVDVDVVHEREAIAGVVGTGRPRQHGRAAAADDGRVLILDDPRDVGAAPHRGAEPSSKRITESDRIDRHAHVGEHAQPVPDERVAVGQGCRANGVSQFLKL